MQGIFLYFLTITQKQGKLLRNMQNTGRWKYSGVFSRLLLCLGWGSKQLVSLSYVASRHLIMIYSIRISTNSELPYQRKLNFIRFRWNYKPFFYWITISNLDLWFLELWWKQEKVSVQLNRLQELMMNLTSYSQWTGSVYNVYS